MFCVNNVSIHSFKDCVFLRKQRPRQHCPGKIRTGTLGQPGIRSGKISTRKICIRKHSTLGITAVHPRGPERRTRKIPARKICKGKIRILKICIRSKRTGQIGRRQHRTGKIHLINRRTTEISIRKNRTGKNRTGQIKFAPEKFLPEKS